MNRLYVGSSPFVPAGWSGTVRVTSGHTPETILAAVDASWPGNIWAEEVGDAQNAPASPEAILGIPSRGHLNYGESYCGHPGTARFLGVQMNRAESRFESGQVWVGLRPLRRPAPGEELDPASDPSAFEGWVMEVL
jgi:hypothetical protein